MCTAQTIQRVSGGRATKYPDKWAGRSSADLHERINEKIAARISDLAHTSLQPPFDLVKEGHAPGRYQLGNPDLDSPAGSREVSREW